MAARRLLRQTTLSTRSQTMPKGILPHQMDDIEVLWELTDEKYWWPAYVVEIDRLDGDVVVANGIIEYESYRKYPCQFSKVEFLASSNQCSLLRHVDENDSSIDSCSWRYSSKSLHGIDSSLEMNFTRSISGPDESNRQCSRRLNGPINRNTKSAETNILHGHSPPESRVPEFEQDQDALGNAFPQNQSGFVEIQKVRSEMVQLQNEMYLLRRHVDTTQSSQVIPTPLLHIRHELLLKMGSRWPFPRTLWTTKSERIITHTLEVNVPCSLRSFQWLVSHVRNELIESHTVAIPSYTVLQSTSLALSSATICMLTIEDVCTALGLRDSQDRMNVKIQKTKANCSFVVQFMGSAGKGKKIQNGKLVDVNRIVVGSSVIRCISGSDQINASPFLSHRHVVIEQICHSWDDGMRCYTAPWITMHHDRDSPMTYPFNNDSDSVIIGTDDQYRNCFRFEWHESKIPSSRKWTSDALYIGDDKLGFLSILLPMVAGVGNFTSSSLSPLLEFAQ